MKKILFLLLISYGALGQNQSQRLENQVRRDIGKGFSKNDFSDSAKAALSRKPDSTHIIGLAPVKSVNGKTGVVVIAPSDLTQTPSYRFVTDAEKATWNSNSLPPSAPASQFLNGTKVFSQVQGADIGQSASYRFTTDAEKTTWNGKVDKATVNTITAAHIFTGIGLTLPQQTFYNLAGGSAAYVDLFPSGGNGGTFTSATLRTWNGAGSTRGLYLGGDGRLEWDNKLVITPTGNVLLPTITTIGGLPSKYKIAVFDTTTGDLRRATWANISPVTSVNGYTGTVVLGKGDVGLSVVPNIDATNADNISSGTLPNSRLSANVVMRNVANSFTGSITPSVDNTYNNGSNTLRWASTYQVNAFTNVVQANGGSGVTMKGSGGQINGTWFNTGNLRLGTGTTDTGQQLQIGGTSTFEGDAVPGTDNTYTFGSASYKWNTIYANTSYANNLRTAASSGNLSILNNAGTQGGRMFASGNWNLGTGTSDPGLRLNVEGAIKASSTITSDLQVATPIVKAASTDISFQSSVGVEAMRIFANGNTYLGTSNPAFPPSVRLTVDGDAITSGSLQSLGGANITGTLSADDIKASTMAALSIIPNGGGSPITFKNSLSARTATMFNATGNWNFGSGTTDLGYTVNVGGTLNASGNISTGGTLTATNAANLNNAVNVGGNLTVTGTSTLNSATTINKSTTGSALVVNAGPGSGGTTFGLHVNGNTGSQSGGIRLHQTSATGVNVLQFSNTSGIIAQWWSGSSGDAYAPNGIGLQAVLGNMDIGIYQSGKEFRVGSAIGMATPPFRVTRAGTTYMALGVIGNGGLATISNGATTPVPSSGEGTIAYQTSDHKLYLWNGSSWIDLTL